MVVLVQSLNAIHDRFGRVSGAHDDVRAADCRAEFADHLVLIGRARNRGSLWSCHRGTNQNWFSQSDSTIRSDSWFLLRCD
jgi:hypothetical protein